VTPALPATLRPLPPHPIHLGAARLVDVARGEYVEPGDLLIERDRIAEVAPEL